VVFPEAIEPLGKAEENRAGAVSCDRFGDKIPSNLLDIFGSTLLQDAAQQVDFLQEQLTAAQNWAGYLDLDQLVEHLEQARQIIQRAVPVAVHPWCRGQGCEHCLHMGYMPDWRALEAKKQEIWSQTS
jgi:hypothetical protein